MSYFSKKYIFTRTKFFNVHSLKFNKTWAIVVSRLNSHWKCNLILLPMTTMQFVMWSKAYCAKLLRPKKQVSYEQCLLCEEYVERGITACVCVCTYICNWYYFWVLSYITRRHKHRIWMTIMNEKISEKVVSALQFSNQIKLIYLRSIEWVHLCTNSFVVHNSVQDYTA